MSGPVSGHPRSPRSDNPRHKAFHAAASPPLAGADSPCLAVVPVVSRCPGVRGAKKPSKPFKKEGRKGGRRGGERDARKRKKGKEEEGRSCSCQAWGEKKPSCSKEYKHKGTVS